MQLTSEHRVKLRISESVSLTENHRELLESLLDPLRSAATAMPISARRGAALPTVHVGRHSQRDATYRNAAPRVPPRGERRSDPAPRAARPLPQRSERCPRRGKRRMCNAAVLNGGKGGVGRRKRYRAPDRPRLPARRAPERQGPRPREAPGLRCHGPRRGGGRHSPSSGDGSGHSPDGAESGRLRGCAETGPGRGRAAGGGGGREGGSERLAGGGRRGGGSGLRGGVRELPAR